jgi:hypothetical protein
MTPGITLFNFVFKSNFHTLDSNLVGKQSAYGIVIPRRTMSFRSTFPTLFRIDRSWIVVRGTDPEPGYYV